MIHNLHAIVLWSRRSREADKVVGLYTREMGRLTARATSAARATAKFAGLTEPFVQSEVALYLVPGKGWGKVVGGQISRSFPGLRTHMERGIAAAWVCEVMHRLTPEEQRSPEKYALLEETLSALETAEHLSVLRLAFAVRFLALAGFGLQHQAAWEALEAEHPEWAEAISQAPLETLGEMVWRSPAVEAVERVTGGLVHDHLSRPLHVNRFRQMAGVEI